MEVLIVILIVLFASALCAIEFLRSDKAILERRIELFIQKEGGGGDTNPSQEVPYERWDVITSEKRYEVYLDNRKWYEGFANKSSDSFEKTMITLSGGALALSITLVNQVDGDAVKFPELVPASWVFFGISLALMLWSYQATTASYDRQIEVLDMNYFYLAEEENELRTLPGSVAQAAVWFLVGGISLLC